MLLVLVAWGGIAVPAVQGIEPERIAAVDLAFQKVNACYQRGQFGDAADGYRTILGRGVESGALYYNLGNALLKRGRIGEAIWAYERARSLLPRDVDVQANLAYARSRIPESAGVSWRPPRWVRWATLGGVMTRHELMWVFGFLLWFCIGCRIIMVWGPGLAAALRSVVWGFAALTIGAGMMLLIQIIGVESVTRAIVIEDRAEVTFAPQLGSTRHFLLPEGACVRVLQHEPGWLRVQRGDGRSGWIREEMLQTL